LPAASITLHGEDKGVHGQGIGIDDLQHRGLVPVRAQADQPECNDHCAFDVIPTSNIANASVGQSGLMIRDSLLGSAYNVFLGCARVVGRQAGGDAVEEQPILQRLHSNAWANVGFGNLAEAGAAVSGSQG
jgi:hypothetical protein